MPKSIEETGPAVRGVVGLETGPAIRLATYSYGSVRSLPQPGVPRWRTGRAPAHVYKDTSGGRERLFASVRFQLGGAFNDGKSLQMEGYGDRIFVGLRLIPDGTSVAGIARHRWPVQMPAVMFWATLRQTGQEVGPEVTDSRVARIRCFTYASERTARACSYILRLQSRLAGC
jgi:hypothetical protein